jgi:hypothetical protein
MNLKLTGQPMLEEAERAMHGTANALNKARI